MHEWYTVPANNPSQQPAGPFSETDLFGAVQAGHIRPDTLVNSPTRTAGQWVAAQTLQMLEPYFSQTNQFAQPPVKTNFAGPSGVPIYGNSAPAPAPKNVVGLLGFIFSIISLVTCGILFLPGLILSAIGAFFKPRGFAVAGMIISLLSIGLAAVIVLPMVMFAIHAPQMMENAMADFQVQADLAETQLAAREFYEEHKRVPSDEELAELLGPFEERKMTFERYEDSLSIRHPGPDFVRGSGDEVKITLDLSEPLDDEERARLETMLRFSKMGEEHLEEWDSSTFDELMDSIPDDFENADDN